LYCLLRSVFSVLGFSQPFCHHIHPTPWPWFSYWWKSHDSELNSVCVLCAPSSSSLNISTGVQSLLHLLSL
jgi:hypothetical protein